MLEKAVEDYSLDPPLREPDIKRTDLAQPPGGLRDGRFQVETAHLPLQNVIFALFRGPGWLREQSTSESSVLLMVGRNCRELFINHVAQDPYMYVDPDLRKFHVLSQIRGGPI